MFIYLIKIFDYSTKYYNKDIRLFITKCGNSISQAFLYYNNIITTIYLTYFVLQSEAKWFYYKVWQAVITKYVRYYKVWQTLLQNTSGITKCDSYYKLRRNTVKYLYQ